MRRAATAVVVATIAFTVVVGFEVGGRSTADTINAVAELLVAIVAGVACSARARDCASRGSRRAWALLAAASLAWAAGEAAWVVYEVVLGDATPFPSIADIGFLALPPLAALGLLSFPAAQVQGRARVRAVFDGLIVACSVLFVSWIVVLEPLYESGDGSGLARALSLAYPIGDTVLLTVALIVGGRVRSGAGRRSFALLALGLGAIAVADWTFAYLTQAGPYTGHVLDVGWFAGFLLIALAALAAGRTADHAPATTTAAARFDVLFPYIPSAFALAAAAGATVTAQFDLFLTVDGLVLMGLLLARQQVTLLENVALTRQLEANVEARTAQLRDQDARFAALARRASDLVSVVDMECRVLHQSESIERILGLSVDRVLGTDLRLLVHPDDRRQWMTLVTEAMQHRSRPIVFEWRVWHADGSWRVLETTVTNLFDEPSVGGFVLNARDVTERKQLEEQLRYNAFHDPLTGLANRALFRDRLHHALVTSSRHRHTVAVLFVDLDDFKAVNDVHGHDVGDDVLAEVACRLRCAVRESDTVARFGGDEFAVLLEHVDGESEAVRAAHRIIEELERPHDGRHGDIAFRASIGIATGFGDGDPDSLLRNADVAMYAAKTAGTHGYEVFRPHMHAVMVDRMRLEADLRRAVEREEFVVHYQPIVEVGTGMFVAVEALLRWSPPGSAPVPPSEFVPVAESSGLIVPIGAWVLRTVLHDVADWQTADGRPLEVNVNLSARQLADEHFVEMVRRALGGTGFDPARLTLEITESLLIDNGECVDGRLRELKAMGVKLAIDDFGTGYSSLAYLHRLPVDELKIDRSFVRALRDDTPDTGVVQTILSLAHHFHLRVVAEGVEEVSELAALVGLGCTRMQGYLFAKPMPAAEFERHPALGAIEHPRAS